MSSPSGALQELTNVANKASQEIEKLCQHIKTKKHIDLKDAQDALKTLHTMSKCAAQCNISGIAIITKSISTALQKIAQNTLEPKTELLESINKAHDLTFSILHHGEEKFHDRIQQTIRQLQKLINVPFEQPGNGIYDPMKSPTTKTLLRDVGLTACSLEPRDLIQLTVTEKNTIIKLYDSGQPIFGYLVHFKSKNLEKDIIHIENTIAQYGSLITILPTSSKSIDFAYAFLFLLTSQYDHDKLAATLPNPGSITHIQKDIPTLSISVKVQA